MSHELNWLRWQRLFSILSLDMIDLVGPYLGLPVEAPRLQGVFQSVVSEYEDVFLWRHTAKPDTSTETVRTRTQTMVADGFKRVDVRFGDGSGKKLSRWAVLLWGDLQGEVWDWFAYQTAFAIWAGRLVHSGIDILELGSTRDALLRAHQGYIGRKEQFEASSRQLRHREVSEWDARTLRMNLLTLDQAAVEPWVDLVAVLRQPVTRAGFQQFWGDMLKTLGPPARIAVHDRTLEILKQQGIPYPPDRDLPLPPNLHPISAATRLV